MTRTYPLRGFLLFSNLSLHERWWSIGFLLSILGLAFSQALFTITLYGLSVAVFIEQLQPSRPKFSVKAIVLLICPWLFVLVIPIVQSIVRSDIGAVFSIHGMHLILLPILCLRLYILSKKAKECLVVSALLICCICAAVLLVKLVQEWSQIGQSIEEGKHLWVPNGQPKATAILFVIAGILGIHYTLDDQEKSYYRIASIVFLLCCVHAMTVRIAWGMLYIGVAFTLFRHFITRRQWTPLLIATLILLVAPFATYQSIPSVQKRIEYTLYDWSTLNKEGEVNTSDALRFISWDVGWKTIVKKPILGYGIESMDKALAEQYAANYPQVSKENMLRPHNQFLFFALEYGLLGAFLSLIALGCLLWFFGRSTGIILWILFFLYCFIDSPFNRQIIDAAFWYGLGFSIVFSKDSDAP
jgi:O-antigen ligase